MPTQTYTVGESPEAIVAGDFTSDHHLDLATANGALNDVSVLLGNGAVPFRARSVLRRGLLPTALVAYDFNGDGRLDLAVGNSLSNDISVLPGRGDGSFQAEIRNPVDEGLVATATADLNGDGHLDLVTVTSQSNDVSVLLGRGDGTFAAPMNFAAGSDPVAVAVGDFNGDGRPDLAVLDGGDPFTFQGEALAILLGNGDGTFQAPRTASLAPILTGILGGAAALTPVSFFPIGLTIGDFNGENPNDLAVFSETIVD